MTILRQFPIMSGTTAERTGGTWTNYPAGWLYVESDGLAIYRWTGSAWVKIADATGGGGEANTASNVGAGQGVWKAKTGVDLSFRSLTATSSKIALANNTNDVGIDVTEANLALANISGTLAIGKGGTGQTTATTAFDALSPMSAIGDLIYGGTAGTRTRLAPNITTTPKFLNMTGDGSGGLAPTWVQPSSRVHFWLNTGSSSTPAPTLKYLSCMGGSTNPITTESNATTVYPYAFTIRRMVARLSVNSLTGSFPISFRDDGADAASVSIPTTVTTEVDSGALSVAVAAGSAICFKIDSTGLTGSQLMHFAYVVADIAI